MELSEITKKLLAAKQEKGLTFAELGKAVGQNEVWIAALFYRQASADQEEAGKLLSVLGLDPSLKGVLTGFPIKGDSGPAVPVDPFIYRFYEITRVYGLPLKSVVQEKFGDGIMSAIDFTMDVEKVEDPKGDRVKLTMNGKFLPYKKW